MAYVVRSTVIHVLPLRLRAVKAALFAADGRVLLCRHAYGSQAWMLPGGLARRGEPFVDAVRREIGEELGLDVEEWRLEAVFELRMGLTKQRLGLLRGVASTTVITPNHEIAEAGFFNPADPPPGVSPATLRRLDDLAAGPSGGAW